MRIAIFTNNYLPNPYGVAASIESFRKEFEKRGHSVYIFAPETKGYADVNPNVFRYPSLDVNYKISFPLAIPFSQRIGKVLENLEIDVIHSQHPNLLGSAAKKWARKKNVPLVFTWHTLYDKYAHFVPIIPTFWIEKWTIGNAVKYANRCDQIIIPTKSVEKIIRDWGVANKNIEAIPTGVDETLYRNPDRSEIREKYAVAENETLLLLVSRLTAEKNVHFLFRAIFKLLQKKSAVKFLVIGGGDERAKLEQMVSENGLAGRVFFAGVVAAAQMKNYYAAGDIFVHASKSETQGMILTEAMYLGLPIVSVDATGAKDLVRSDVTGILVSENEEEFAAAVTKLAEDGDLRQKYGEAAKEIAQEFYTSSVCAGKMLAVYAEAIARRK